MRPIVIIYDVPDIRRPLTWVDSVSVKTGGKLETRRTLPLLRKLVSLDISFSLPLALSAFALSEASRATVKTSYSVITQTTVRHAG